ncbi:MAG TPA: PfkB family carbohydrate kinase [Candidatus Krumholzibacterium sp.]|nr:PfkB family carbohydrate kinase [Candidatus Krumholzibacterium sp.]
MPDKKKDRVIDAVSVGYTAVDCLGTVDDLPAKNSKLEMDEFTIQGGGPAATAAVTLSRLGLATAFTGKVGDDLFGSYMLDRLRDEGVDVSSTVVEEGGRSQFAFIMIDRRSAERTILWTRGSLSPLSPREIDAGLIAGARGLLVDSLEPAAALEAAKTARENGVQVVIDAGTLREGVREVLPFCDHIVGSELFASQISAGGSVEDALREIACFGPDSSVVTLGERGCAFLDDGRVRYVEGFNVDAKDTTGAGDVFHGAFLAGVLAGYGLYGTCVFSNAVAALKCRSTGGRQGIPGLEEALRFIERERPGTGLRP